MPTCTVYLVPADVAINFTVILSSLSSVSTECVSLDKFEALQKELEAQKLDFKLELDALKDELHYWQNSTLSLLMKYALSEQGVL